MESTEFSPDSRSGSAFLETSAVRIRASQPDPYAGLKGHAYIEARGLAQQVRRVQTPAHVSIPLEAK